MTNLIIASTQDTSVFSTLSAGAKTVDKLNKQLDIDQLEEIKDKLEEQRADMEEKT